jgi:hypothetical protein
VIHAIEDQKIEHSRAICLAKVDDHITPEYARRV